jgi:uncharacterized protein (TIGR03435 family)
VTTVHGGPGDSDTSHVTYRNISLMNLLGRVYPDSFRVEGPGWLDMQRYDVVATMPAETTADQFRIMLRNLLAERFGLKAHHETRDLPAYDLVIAKGGLKLKEAAADTGTAPGAASGPLQLDADGFPQLTRPGMTTMNTIVNGVPVARLTARAQPIWRIVGMLRAAVQKPVIDKTGLTGKYDFTLEYAPGGAMAVASPSSQGNPPEAEVGAPGIAYAIKSLGLALQDTKATLDVLVVDSANKVPTEN